MRNRVVLSLCVAAIFFARGQAPAFASSPWSEIASGDLTAIHTLLLENHAGPVDKQNPKYRVWLEDGFKNGLARAKSAQTYFDYKRALLSYIAGFRDEHTRISPAIDATFYEWPGFLPGVDADGAIRIGVSEEPGVAVGDMIISCDGMSIEELFERNVAPYYWNRDIPQARNVNMPRTLMIDGGDEASRVKSCDIESGSGSQHVELQWRIIPRAEGLKLRAEADGRVTPELGLHNVGGIWFLSFPSFDYQSAADVTRFKGVLKDIAARAEELRLAPRIVIDVRGNTGGISDWGLEAARDLWGSEIVQDVSDSLPGDVDWRASKSNYDHIDDFLRHAKENGLPAHNIAELTEIGRLIKGALARHEPLAREPGPAKPVGMLPQSKLKGTVYFLTDEICTSACLDYADVVLRLPNVVHIGRPTNADALYIDLNHAELPSGLGVFLYSMKVFRTRVRGNNQWYQPKYLWPGGPMNDYAIAKWVSTLPTAIEKS